MNNLTKILIAFTVFMLTVLTLTIDRSKNIEFRESQGFLKKINIVETEPVVVAQDRVNPRIEVEIKEIVCGS